MVVTLVSKTNDADMTTISNVSNVAIDNNKIYLYIGSDFIVCDVKLWNFYCVERRKQ
jgi:hypothetical protein